MTRRHIAEMLKMLEAQGLKKGCAMRADHASRPRVPALSRQRGGGGHMRALVLACKTGRLGAVYRGPGESRM